MSVYSYFILIFIILSVSFIYKIKRKHNYLDPMYLVLMFYGANYLISPYVIYTTGVSFDGEYWDYIYFKKTLSIVVISLISFIVIYYSQSYKILMPFLPIIKGRESNNKIVKTIFITFVILIVFQSYHIFALGGLTNFINAVLTDRAFYKVGFGHIVPFTNLAIFIFPLAMLFGWHNRKFNNLYRYIFLFIALTSLFITLIKFARFQLLLSMSIYYIGYYYSRDKKPNIKRIIIFVMILMFSMFFIRDIKVGREFIFGQLLTMIQIFFLQTFSSFEMLASTVSHYPKQYDFFYGQTIFEVITYQFVPRIIWESKPLVYGTIAITEPITNAFLIGRTAVTPSFIAEGYANFGIIGPVISNLFHATILRATYEKYVNKMPVMNLTKYERVMNMIVYATIYMNTLFILRLGFSSYTTKLTLEILPIILIVFIMSKRFKF